MKEGGKQMKIKRKIRFPRDVLIRMTVLMIALTNQILELTGRNPLPFSEEEWYQILSGMVTVMTALWIWLKNEKKEGKK
ncbi:phage holin [Blautia sp. MCC270]|jgi:SPP1 family holin|nr:phage holin [Ruminococcus sp.]MBE5704250.1 phage holin [Ruminococcus sp.]MBT9837401.1 phage holin [Blautia sp. MCC270]